MLSFQVAFAVPDVLYLYLSICIYTGLYIALWIYICKVMIVQMIHVFSGHLCSKGVLLSRINVVYCNSNNSWTNLGYLYGIIFIWHMINASTFDSTCLFWTHMAPCLLILISFVSMIGFLCCVYNLARLVWLSYLPREPTDIK